MKTMVAQNQMIFGIGDGYEAIENARRVGWRPIPSWGRDGWDLGSWPLVIVLFREQGTFEVAEYVEGDVTHFIFDTEDERNAHVDQIAMWHWKHNEEPWVADYRLGDSPRPEHCGPYSRERHA